jgi:GMP synthase (glutamine-hydrolysing)
MSNLRFLVVDGNVAERRDAHAAAFGKAPGQAYGDALLGLAPKGSVYDVCFPSDHGSNLPTAAGLADYDGIALTGSALHLWQREPAVNRQIELAREAFRAKTAFFGSCWGLQMACVAAGGDVQKNPIGREVGFARHISLNEAGRVHPLLKGRPASFDAPAVHLDIVTQPSSDHTLLASNRLTPMQAAEIRQDGGVFWGIQYHPEFSLTEVAVILKRLADPMIAEGFARDAEAVNAYADDLITLDKNRSRQDIAWKLGLDEQVLDDTLRMTEIQNWIDHQVKPMASARGRA